MNNKLPSLKILGVSVTNAPKHEILEYIIRGLKNRDKKFYIVTTNPEMLVFASASRSYKEILNHAQIALPDGIGIVAAGNILKKGVNERITGVDFMMEIVGRCAEEGLSIGLLGGSRGVAERTAECLREKYPNLRVSFAGDKWVSSHAGPAASHLRLMSSSITSSDSGRSTGPPRSAASPALNHHPQINRKSPITTSNHIDILFVALGVPKQEEWIAKNLDKIPVTAAMGVGGSFDFISGKVRRAPKVVRSMGMEWAFRLAIQPWRVKRQLALPKFAYMVLKEKVSR